MSKETEIFTDLMLIIEDNSSEIDLIIHTLISLLNDKQLKHTYTFKIIFKNVICIQLYTFSPFLCPLRNTFAPLILL